MSRLAVIALVLCAGAARADDVLEPATAGVPDESVPRAGTPAERRFATMDRLELDTTAITGSQELPKVLYIVPWKKPFAGELPEPPVSSLLDEILAPVDREVFRRQVSYYEELHSEEQ